MSGRVAAVLAISAALLIPVEIALVLWKFGSSAWNMDGEVRPDGPGTWVLILVGVLSLVGVVAAFQRGVLRRLRLIIGVELTVLLAAAMYGVWIEACMRREICDSGMGYAPPASTDLRRPAAR